MTDHLRRLPEFAGGRLEAFPMPTDRHQVISPFLFLALFPFVRNPGGTIVTESSADKRRRYVRVWE